MGFTDDITVLWTKETYEADLETITQTVSETGSPFALIENIFSDTTQADLAADAYRQVSYVNDINCENTRVLMEYTTDGTLGTSTTAYTYGLRRETYTMTASLSGVGNVILGMTTENSGTYYYTGTGSVSNLINRNGRNTSCTYTPDGIKTTYVMNARGSTDIQGKVTIPKTADTYENYDYNGEYTHTSLGIQYLRARYYKMATGTFTSKDTYAGTLTDTLSQNRYTYAENNPVTYADPSGHFSIKNAWNTVKAGASAVRTVAKATAGTVANVVKRTYNAGGSVAKQVIDTINRQITYGSMSTITTSADRMLSGKKPAFNDFLTSDSLNDYVREQKNAAWMEGFSKILSFGFGPDLEQLAGAIPGTTPWAASVAAEIERKKCEAYDYCRNEVQELIKGKDIMRIMNGIGLIASGLDKSAGGAALALLSFKATVFGIGIAGMVASAFLVTSSYSDFEQGVNEIRLGWQGNSLTPTANGVRDVFYDGNEMAYQFSTNIASMVSTMGLAFVQTKPNPTIVGETDNIAEKAAMQADDAIEGGSGVKTNTIPDNDSTVGHIFRDAEGHIPDTPENRTLLEDVANNAENFRGTDKYGNEWYTEILEDGREVWVESRSGNIFEGGINEMPKLWNPDTGLKKQ